MIHIVTTPYVSLLLLESLTCDVAQSGLARKLQPSLPLASYSCSCSCPIPLHPPLSTLRLPIAKSIESARSFASSPGVLTLFVPLAAPATIFERYLFTTTMLVRNVVARLAADAPKSSTHDLSRAANLIQRKLLFSNGVVASLSSSRSRAYRATLLQSRRSYATEARATKPTPKVKQDVKKAAAQKTASKTATTKAGKKPAAKKAVKKAVKPIKKKKKPVAKAKPKRVAKTPEEKAKIKVAEDKAKLREYRAKALNPPVFPKHPTTAWTVFQTEQNAEKFPKGQRATITKEIQSVVADKYKNLTPAEREASDRVPGVFITILTTLV